MRLQAARTRILFLYDRLLQVNENGTYLNTEQCFMFPMQPDCEGAENYNLGVNQCEW